MIEDFDPKKLPTAKEMGMREEFVYSVRIVQILSKINFENTCEKNEAINSIEKVFHEYKNKIINNG